MLNSHEPQASPKSVIETGTPVDAVAATKVLTVGGIPLDNETVSIGGQVYKFENAMAPAGVAAYADFTSAAIANGNTFKIGTTTDYTFRTYVGAAVKASSNGVFSSFVADTKWIKLGATTYTYKTALTAAASSGLFDLDAKDFGTATCPEGSTVTVGTEIYEFDSDGSITAGHFLVDCSDPSVMTAAQGTLTIDTQPTVGNTMTIGVGAGLKVFTFVAEVDADANGEIGIGADLAGAQSNIKKAINGTDGFNTAHTQVTADTFALDNCILTAKIKGDFGETIATTETFTAVTNIFDDVTLGTTTASVNCDVVDAAEILKVAINNNSLLTNASHAALSDQVPVVAKVKGVAGDAIVLAVSSGDWIPTGLAGGADSVANEILVEATAEATLDNFVAATTGGAGVGVKYSTGTVAHTTVDVTKTNASTIHAVAKTAGLAGNALDTTTNSADFAWTGLTLASGQDLQNSAYDVWLGINDEAAIDNAVLAITAGAGAGTNYGTGTTVHPTTTAAKTAANKMTVTAKTIGDAGNAIALLNTGNFTKGSATLLHGEDTEAANGVLIGASAELSIDNLVSAILTTAGDEGVKWGTGTVVNAYVTAAKTAADKMTITGKVKGSTFGNTVALEETLSNGSWAGAATALTGGIDGTAGPKGKILYDSAKIYVAIDEATITDTGKWKQVALGAL